MRSVSDSLANLPRSLAAALAVSVFLLLINVFSGLDRIWFHWPAASLLFIATLRTVLRRKPAPERTEERRTNRSGPG
jgi:adenylate cyclase